jgi:hypothetical protein
VRAGPRDDAEQVTQLVGGEPLSVETVEGEWARIRTDYGYPGWVRTRELAGSDVLLAAREYLDAPYEWGGLTAAGIDCSGLVHAAFRRTGHLVPRDADQQEDAATEIDESELQAGDLITYGDESGADHIAFWVGAGRILHATGRAGVESVVEEAEPDSLRTRRRKLLRGSSLISGRARS